MRVAYDARIVPESELGNLNGNPPTNETITELECARQCANVLQATGPRFFGVGAAIGLTVGVTAGALVGHWLGKRAAEKESGRHGDDV